MDTQSGFRVDRWGEEPTWQEFARSAPGVGELEVAVEACGIGLTVINCINGDLADENATLPRVPGHELVGRVERIGVGVERSLLGRRVAAYFYRYCGACAECWRGRQATCRNFDGFIGVHSDGGYAPYAVMPARNAVSVAEDLHPVAATVIPDAVATPVHVCRSVARLGPDDRVVVIGAAGGVGAHMLQVARLFGPQVAGLDIGEAKLRLIRDLGATAVDSSDFPAVETDALFKGRPPTVVIDLVGSESSLAWSCGVLDTGGRLILLTTYRDSPVTVEPRMLVLGERRILGSRYASVADVQLAAELVELERVRPVVGRVVGPDDVLGVHQELRHGLLLGRGALEWR